MLPLRVRVNLGAMAMKGYSAFPKALALLDLTIRLFSVICRTLINGGGGVLPLCRDSVDVLYSHPTTSQLGKKKDGSEVNVVVTLVEVEIFFSLLFSFFHLLFIHLFIFDRTRIKCHKQYVVLQLCNKKKQLNYLPLIVTIIFPSFFPLFLSI